MYVDLFSVKKYKLLDYKYLFFKKKKKKKIYTLQKVKFCQTRYVDIDCLVERFIKLLALSQTNPKVKFKTIQLKRNVNVKGSNIQIVHQD